VVRWWREHTRRGELRTRTTGQRVTLSVVMPAYNEADHIEQSVSEWLERIVSAIPGAELMVVNDCSTDGTGEKLDAMARRIATLRVLRTPVNMGHGRAVRLALEQCTGEFIFQTDSDRQHTPDDFWPLWNARDSADFIFGVRNRRADGIFRTIVSTAMRVANMVIWQVWIADANCPFKLMRRAALDPMLAVIPRSSFIPMVMVSVLARRGDVRVREFPIRHYARMAGHHSLAGLLTWARVGPRCLWELLAMRFAAPAKITSAATALLRTHASPPR
jgi:glycosyltransferase involved in cell wall biosynthesis